MKGAKMETNNNEDIIDKTISKVTEKFTEKFKPLEDKVDSFVENISNEMKNLAPKHEEPKNIWDSSDDDETVYLTKQEAKNMLREVINEAKINSEKTAEKAASSVVNKHNRKTSLDIQALREYPEVNNQKMLLEVEKEMTKRMQEGRSHDDITLFSDSVAAVYAKGVRDGRIVPKHYAENITTNMNAGDDSFGGSPNNKTQNEALSASNIAFANKVGLNTERFKQLYEKYGKK